jgi:hypothetical protein
MANEIPAQHDKKQQVKPGLCDSCKHARKLTSAKGSLFIRCELALTDARFPKYPRLPVWRCEGFEKDAASGV